MGWRSRPVHRFGQREAEVKEMARNSPWLCISLLFFLFGVTGKLFVSFCLSDFTERKRHFVSYVICYASSL